jgi:polynucleotide 5'-hydroxyl-kinase GRC3/NOL9
MPGKRKREEVAGSSTVASGKPLTAIAAARLRTEAAAKIVNAPEVTLEPAPVPASILPESEELDDDESEVEEEDAPIKRNFRLCNWRNETQNILSDTDSELTINLTKHTTVALVGYFEFKILRGAVNINGANIGTVGRDGQKNRVYRACMPATHPISKIRGLDGTNHVLFKSCKAPTPLAHINPLFENLWNARSEGEKNRSFCVVRAAFLSNFDNAVMRAEMLYQQK